MQSPAGSASLQLVMLFALLNPSHGSSFVFFSRCLPFLQSAAKKSNRCRVWLACWSLRPAVEMARYAQSNEMAGILNCNWLFFLFN